MQACARGIRTATVVVAVLIGICLPAASAVEISVLSTAKEVAPGSFATHVFAVANDASSTETFILSFDAPPEWGVLGAPTSITIGAGGEETLFVTFTLPSGALAGQYTVILTATSENDPTATATSTASVIVTPTREIELLPPMGASVTPGDAIEYEFVLINGGNLQDSFSINATSSKGFPITISTRAVPLAPQERVTIHVRMDVAAGTAPGRDVLTLTATSTLYDDVEVDAVVFTNILPPGPDQVSRNLMEILPVRIRLSMDNDVFTDEFSSRLTFSTSGQILGGFFSANINLSDPLGPDPLEIGSFSILYRRTPATYAIGNVSQRLTELIRLSCRGGSLIIDEELFELSAIGGGSNDETRFAGRLTLGPDVANFGVAYLGIRDPAPTYKAVWSATANAEPLEDWTIQAEAALGIDGALSSRALFFNTEINTSGLFFSGSAFSVGTHFPGSRADSAGIEVSYRLRLKALSLSMSLEHVWDNVIRDPLSDTLIRDDLGINLTTTPLQDGPTLGTTIEFTWDRYPDVGIKSDIDTLVAVNLTETSGVFPYAFTGKITDQIDHVVGTHVRRSTFSEGAGVSVDSFYLFLQLTQEEQVDVVHDLVLSSSSDVSFRFRPEGALHEASITFRNTVDEFDLSASIQIEFVENLDIVFDGSISWDRVDSDSISFGWGISLNADIDIPAPFLVTKGQIEGRAFIDRDGDGIYGLEDHPLGGIIVVADGSEASTDSDGYFRFTPRYPEAYTLTTRQLPARATAGEPIIVELVSGRTIWADIPLTPVVVITGRLFDDQDRNGIQDAEEGGLAQVRALLNGETGLVADVYTDSSGQFAFPGIPPGRYTISLDMDTVPDRFVFTTAEKIAFDIAATAPPPIAFGGYVRPREVIITFQPPTADFSYLPEAPTVGELVTFDGTLAFDFDGQIVSYEWDFDGDGTPDATDAVVTHTFQEHGTFEVSLSVVDDSGNSDTIIVSIEVAVAEGAPTASISTFHPPVADFAFMPSSPVAGEVVQFDGTLSADFDGEISAFAWDFDGDGTTDATNAIVTHTFTSPGEYSVALTVTDSSGSVDTAVLSVAIGGTTAVEEEPPTGLPIAAFQRSPLDPLAGEPVMFNGTSSLDPDGQITEFAWDFNGDGQVDSVAPLAEHTFPEPGSYIVSLTVADDDGNIDTIATTIPVVLPPIEDIEPSSFQLPVADFAYMPAAPKSGDPILFNGTFSFDFDGEIAAFAWDFDGDGTIDSTSGIAEHSFAEPGTYMVSLTVTDDGGNSDTISFSISIE